MPWYWSDDVARFLGDNGHLNTAELDQLKSTPVAIRIETDSLQKASEVFVGDDEPPLAA